jgi:glycosyltransferase involved in cell wall biosynthesis
MINSANEGNRKAKLALSINIIAPYRLPIYTALAKEFDVLILHGGQEANRSWSLQLPDQLKAKKVWTMQVPVKKQTGVAGVKDISYLHLNLGLLWDLPSFRPDIIISNEMGLRTAIALLYGKVARVPVWVWWGGTMHTERFLRPWKRAWRSLVSRGVRNWISYGVSSTKYLESLGVKKSKVLQIQNCVRQESFQISQALKSNRFQANARPVILTVGQLIDRKGLDKLIEACGRQAAKGRKFSLVIVGKGPERERLSEMAKQNRIVEFEILPNQQQAELNEIYRSADVFVFPTMEDVWGLVVNEAIWAGLPVLCSEHAGCVDEIVPTQNIFDPMSEESFDRALERVFDGSLYPSDASKLRTWQSVSAAICASLRANTPLQ